MASAPKSDSALLAELTRDQQLLKEKGSLNGTSDEARARLAEATARGLDLKKKKLEPLQKYLSGQPDHSIDRGQVSRFARLLGRKPNEFLTRAFPHKDNPNKKAITARQGKLDPKNFSNPELWQREGRGLYVVINEGGNTADAITSCSANFFELDNLPKAKQLEQIDRIPELKDLIGMMVATRDGNDGSLHTYFLLEEPVTDIWRWRLMQWRLIQLYKSDSKVEDPSRVMRLPGAWYVMGDGSFHSRSQIVDDRTTGRRLTLEELEKAVAEAEEVRSLSPFDAVPKSRRREEAVKEMMDRLFPEEVKKQAPEKKASFADTVQKFQASSFPKRTLEEIKAALAVMPPRIAHRNTYEECRLVFGGLAGALESIELEPGHAIALIEEAGWEGWNAEQILDSSTVWSEGYFWNHAKKCGFDSDKWKKERQQKKAKESVAQFRSELIELHSQNLTGSLLTAELMQLAVSHHQQFGSVRKAYDELIQNERGVERMSEALDLITAAQDEPISVEELVPAEFRTEVIDDFRKGIVAAPLLILMLVLTTMSSVLPIGTKVRLLDYTNHDQAVLLYFLILMMSGGKKTLLYDEVVEKPIHKSGIRARAEQKYKTVKKQQAHDKKKRSEKKEVAPEEENRVEEDSPESVPVQPLRHISGDFTGEGIDKNCQQAAAHYGHGWLLGTDEGRQLLSGDQYKGGASTYTTDKLTRLYDGKGGNQLRGDSRNERHYNASHMAIAALLQPEIYDDIAAKAADDESGFWPRFLTVESAPVKMRRGTPEELNAAMDKSYPQVLADLYDYCNQLGSHLHKAQLGKEPYFRFSNEAQVWWTQRAWEIEDQQEQHATNGDPMVARVMGKAAGQVGRLAALLHILNRAFNGGISDGGTPSVEIPLETVEKAYLLQARLMSRTIRQRVRATGTGSKDDTKLLHDLQSRCMEKDPQGEGLKLGAIERFWNQKNRPEKDDLYQAVTALAAEGFGELRFGNGNRGGFVYTALKPLTS